MARHIFKKVTKSSGGLLTNNGYLTPANLRFPSPAESSLALIKTRIFIAFFHRLLSFIVTDETLVSS
jgi:hypothetical protein